jgi:hypothetical protein
MMRTAALVIGFLYLAVSAAWGSSRLLIGFIGTDLAALVGIATFIAMFFVFEKAFPAPTPDPDDSVEARLAKLASRSTPPPDCGSAKKGEQ